MKRGSNLESGRREGQIRFPIFDFPNLRIFLSDSKNVRILVSDLQILRTSPHWGTKSSPLGIIKEENCLLHAGVKDCLSQGEQCECCRGRHRQWQTLERICQRKARQWCRLWGSWRWWPCDILRQVKMGDAWLWIVFCGFFTIVLVDVNHHQDNVKLPS